MKYANPDQTWAEWLADNADTATGDHALAVLREYIAATAKDYVGTEPGLTAAWMNKKLAALGVTDKIEHEKVYELTGTVTGQVTLKIYGRNRAEAADKFRALLDGHNRTEVMAATLDGDPTFTSGPEDTDPNAVDPDAPTTVQDTLVKLREYIMLAHVAGPKICDTGANRVLARFGLAELPELKTFTVTRPVEAVATTTVKAWDAESAIRVAGWRWEDDRSGYTVGDVSATDAPQLVADSAS